MIKTFFSAILLTSVITLCAQETASTSGGEASGSGGALSYTVGQTVYTTNTGTSGSVAQGVQQVYEISTINGINMIAGISLQISAYPNPTSDFLVLSVDESVELSGLSYRLYDINGKLLYTKKITANETSVDMNDFIPAAYFIKITDDNVELKTFQIIKN